MSSKLDQYAFKKRKPTNPTTKKTEIDDLTKLFDPIKAEKWLTIDPCGSPC